MMSSRSFFLLARGLPLLALLAMTPVPAAAQLTGEVRERLAREAEQPSLPAWQREFMRRLTGSGGARPDDPAALAPSADAADTTVVAEDGRWWELTPGGRFQPSAIYDPRRDRMVVFGGYDGARARADVWALSLGERPTWTDLTPGGASPAARFGASAIYDPLGDRLVVFGGQRSAGGLCSDTWALPLDGPAQWTQLALGSVPPSPREGHSAIYDPVRRRMVIYGGRNAEITLSDAQALSLEGTPAWTVLGPPFPWPARCRHAAVYDPVRDRMVVIGGSTLDEAWALSFADTLAWRQLAPTGTSPGAGFRFQAVYDSLRDRIAVYGGWEIGAWTLSLGENPEWKVLTQAWAQWLPRQGFSAIHDVVRDRMVIFGGACNEAVMWPMDSVWAVPLADDGMWTDLGPVPEQPLPRNDHSAVYDPAGRRMVIFGGQFYDGTWYSWYLDDVWALSLTGEPRWSALAPSGTPPPGREFHSAIHDPVRNRMIVYGGAITDAYYGDVWALSLGESPEWVQLVPAGVAPGLRAFHGAVYDPVRDRMLVFGGYDGPYPSGVLRTDVWALSLGEPPVWEQLATSGSPPAAVAPRGVVYDPVGDRLLVVPDDLDGVWALSLGDSPTWVQLSPAGTSPGARGGTTVVHDAVRNRLILFGGYTASDRYTRMLNDTWELALGSNPTWSQIAPSGTPPSARIYHSAIYDAIGDRMVVFGGGQSVALPAETWFLALDHTVPVQLALVSADAEPGRVRLNWYAASGGGLKATVYRCAAAGTWVALGTISADGTGALAYEDRTVAAGTRYGYRLGVMDGGAEEYLGEAWVDVPAQAMLALAGARPNPGTSVLAVAFTLPDGSPARLEAYDVAGRRVASREVGTLGAGGHVVSLGEGAGLRCGMYLVRLTCGERTLTTRAVVVR